VICADCAHAEMRCASDPKRDRSLKALAREGLVVCGQTMYRATIYPAMVERECSLFGPADAEVAGARRAWFIKQAERIQCG
jgi:hypothetical protein